MELRDVHIGAGPFHGRCHPLLFYPMMICEHIVNATGLPAPFRMNILGVLEKPERTGKGQRHGGAR